MIKGTQLQNPDSRNSGGRFSITSHMYNHQKALLNTKSTINTFKAPKKHVDANKQSQRLKKPLFKELEKFGEVFETFKKVEEINNGMTDTSCPKSLHYKKMLKHDVRNGGFNKGEQFIYEEHTRNIMSQQRKIYYGDLFTKHERQKNKFDPIVHPSLFFRRKNQVQDIQIDSLWNKVSHQPGMQLQKTQYSNKKLRQKEMPHYKEQLEGFESNNIRPKSAIVRKQVEQQDEKEEEENEQNNFLIPVPQAEGNNEEAYLEIKKQLIQTIIKYEIYKNEDYESLFERTLLYNQHLDPAKLKEIFEFIKEELNR